MPIENHSKLVNDLTIGAKEYLNSNATDEELLELATESWSYAEMTTSQARPTIDNVKKLIQDIVKGVVKDITTKHRDLSVVTLSIATDMFLAYIETTLGWSLPNEFIIPKKVIIALIYRQILKDIGKSI